MNYRNFRKLLLLSALLTIYGLAMGGESKERSLTMDNTTESRIRLSFAGREAIVTVYDHPTTRDLLSRLPLTLTFQDYVGKEKISYLDKKLASNGSSAERSGEFAYYAPWGNLAIFYNGTGNAGGGLIVMGAFESGKEELAAMHSEFTLTLERMP